MRLKNIKFRIKVTFKEGGCEKERMQGERGGVRNGGFLGDIECSSKIFWQNIKRLSIELGSGSKSVILLFVFFCMFKVFHSENV